VLTIRRSKTDREAAGASVAVPLGGEEATCPVGALRRWLETAAVGEGRVFRRIDRHGNLGAALSDRALAKIVASRAAAGRTRGRLRRAFAARRYIRQGARWDDNPATDLGL
jgi:hypothetical protein